MKSCWMICRRMGNYNIRIKKSVAKDLRSLPNEAVKQLLARINSLRENPRASGCIKLSTKERYRVRQGVYRILYEINDHELIIVVVKVAHRKNVYEKS